MRSCFGSRRAVDLTTADAELCQRDRLQNGKARATVNRELEVLRHPYRLASTRTPKKIHPARVPLIPMLEVDNARQDFLSRADFIAIISNIDDPDLCDFIEWGWWTGMRKGEIAALTWDGYDDETDTVRLHSSAAKNKTGRVLVLEGPLRDIFERRLSRRLLSTRLIVHRRGGRPVKDFAKASANACRAAGLKAGRDGGLTFHDMRRSAVRNMVRAGVERGLATAISGHKTDSTGETRQLTWSMYDRETATLNLSPRADKIRRGRVLAVTGPLGAIIDRRKARRRLDCALVFHRFSKGKHGQPVRDYRRQWRAALKEAGLALDLLPYDLRRSALRNMVRAGVDVTVAMKISGHRTRSTFDRYKIADAADIEAAIKRTAEYVERLPAANSKRKA